MGPRVRASIRRVVRAEARIIFIGQEPGRLGAAWRRIAQSMEKQNAEASQTLGNCSPPAPHFETQRNPDQSSATRMESVGLEASYLILAGCPATSYSNRIWLSSPLMPCGG